MTAEKSFFSTFFLQQRCFMLRGTNGPPKRNVPHVQSLKKDRECLRWIAGHILKVLTLGLRHMSTFPWAFSIFSVKLMNRDVEKVSLQAHNEE